MLTLATTLILAVLPFSAAPAPTPTPTPAAIPPVSPAAAAGAAPGAAATPPLKPLPAWWTRVNAGRPGTFAAPRPFKGVYRVSWEGVEAAHLDSQCTAGGNGNEITTLVKVHTTGVTRAMWKFDATHLSVVDRQTLKPLRLEQIEDQGRNHTVDRVEFTPQTASRTTYERGSDDGKERKPRVRSYDYPGLFDMESAFLYMRSLPLAIGQTATLALMTSGSPYLTTIRVVGHGKVQVKAGEFPAYEYAVSLEKINKHGALEPRKGFKSAHAWISDDANRVILKVQADVFVGAVNVELETIQFTDGGR